MATPAVAPNTPAPSSGTALSGEAPAPGSASPVSSTPAPTPKPNAGVGALPPPVPTPPEPPPSPPPGDAPPKPDETPVPKPDDAPIKAAPLTAADLKMADGIKPDDGLLGDFVPMANEWGLGKAQAQKLVDLYTKAQKAQAEQAASTFEATQRQWVEALKTDTEIGGADFDKHLGLARKAIVKFGTPELKAILDSSGMGNHPELVKFVARVGKALAEDSVAGTSSAASASPSNNEDAFHRALYPNTPQMWGRGNS